MSVMPLQRKTAVRGARVLRPTAQVAIFDGEKMGSALHGAATNSGVESHPLALLGPNPPQLLFLRIDDGALLLSKQP